MNLLKKTVIQNHSESKINLKNYLWLLLPLVLSPIKYAHAYLDAGTGSYAIQIAIGVIFGGAYAFKSFAGKIVSRFSRKNKNDKES
jgi:hypothetical protein